MHHKRLKLSILLMVISGLIGLQAQEVIPASGSSATGSGGTVSYTVGQVVYTTHTGTNGSVVQGVQQPYEISVVSGIEQASDIHLICLAYPNPTIDFLTLSIENYNYENLSYQLFDMTGKLIESKKITVNKTSITMTNQVSAIYFLKIIKGNQSSSQHEIKTFKIIKK